MSVLCLEQVTFPGVLRPRLASFSFELKAGECAFLLGPNGAGKSTLLRAALGLERPSSGRVLLGRTKLEKLSPKQRAERVAWLPQQLTFEQALTAEDVVAIARYRFHESRTVAAVKAREWLDHVAAGELATRRVTELSGGEQQRVKLAALLAQEAPLLLLDEPANHLDPAQQVEVYQVLSRQWQRGSSVLCVTHDINLVSVVGDPGRVRLLGLCAGELCFDTRFSDPNLCQKLELLYGLPFEELRRQHETTAGAAQKPCSGRLFAPCLPGNGAQSS